MTEMINFYALLVEMFYLCDSSIRSPRLVAKIENFLTLTIKITNYKKLNLIDLYKCDKHL